MYTSISKFKKDWKYESDGTIKMLENLTNESLNQKITPDGRSLGFLAWHLIQTIPEMLGNTGLKIDGPSPSEDVPSTVKEIIEAYKKSSDSFIEQLDRSWKDETLLIQDEMYGEKWDRGLTLLYLMLHQTHHRGQMTVLMRQAGLKVTGIYGPAKEEWAAMGMQPMK
jgi:uncharacterized damage-inducible protein DinB